MRAPVLRSRGGPAAYPRPAPARSLSTGRLGGHAYAIDDATAFRVVYGEVDVVSEGTWRYFPPAG
ncbi:hypothetical protein [Agromyces sp. SYSU T00194]|uniref:hypothetical protein n=1 Tax=Agromyces chitinivorans TaxID=3158560 RepID=UPI003395DC5E